MAKAPSTRQARQRRYTFAAWSGPERRARQVRKWNGRETMYLNGEPVGIAPPEITLETRIKPDRTRKALHKVLPQPDSWESRWHADGVDITWADAYDVQPPIDLAVLCHIAAVCGTSNVEVNANALDDGCPDLAVWAEITIRVRW